MRAGETPSTRARSARDAGPEAPRCAKIAERLAQPDAIFRDTLIGNADEVCDVLQRLNVTNDPDLESMRVRVKKELTRYTPDTLRDVPSHRQQTADRAADILKTMEGFFS